MAESLIAAAVLLAAVVALSAAVSAGHMQGYQAAHAQRATVLAEELMEFILSLPYDDPQGASKPGPEAGEAAFAGFDNADDFHGFLDKPGEVRDMSGQVYPAEYQLFRRGVAAQYGSENVAGLGDPIAGLTVTVTVRDQEDSTWTITRFIAQPTD